MTSVAARLLKWYDDNRRDLPWRYAPGSAADPYRVWLSEVMLQQTVVKAVIPYFETFITRWPTVADLAAAPLDDVLAAWAGLGYYSRARNLHAAAQAVVRDHNHTFPHDQAVLRTLPGVGAYTAAAIAAIGHGRKATPVDGNIERVVARLFAVDKPLPFSKSVLRAHAEILTPNKRAGDYAQAMMDLGATICTPRSPACARCPLSSACLAFKNGMASELPRKAAKPERPTLYATAFVVQRSTDHAVLLGKRPPKGLLGGMHELPSTPWTDSPAGNNTVRGAMPVDAIYRSLAGRVEHVFTHFRLLIDVHATAVSSAKLQPPLFWAPVDTLHLQALPTVMRKVLAHAGIKVRSRRT